MDRMDEWPVWRRWGALVLGWVVYLGGFAALVAVSNWVLRGLALVALLAGLWLAEYAAKAVVNERMRKADRWKRRVTLPVLGAYLLLMLYVWPLEAHLHNVGLRWLLVLSPAIAVLVVIWATARYCLQSDELEQRQQLEAAALAGAVVGIAAFALGLLVTTKLVVFNSGLLLLMVLPALLLVFGCTRAWTRWRNRAR